MVQLLVEKKELIIGSGPLRSFGLPGQQIERTTITKLAISKRRAVPPEPFPLGKCVVPPVQAKRTVQDSHGTILHSQRNAIIVEEPRRSSY